MKGLTERQHKVLDYIEGHLEDNGYWPSIREIQSAFGFKSTNAVIGHLKALEKKQYITRMPGQARAYKIMAVPGHVSSIRKTPSNVLTLTIYGSIAAGYPDRVEPGEAIGTLQIDIQNSKVQNTEKVFALKVRGDSMVDVGILDGDFVVIETCEPAHNNVVAALIDGETTLKRFIHNPGHPPFLKAENRAYPDLKPALELQVQGVVRSVVRSL